MRYKRPRTDLPVEAALAPLCAALRADGVAVLTAPPGAGKTTLAPLAMLSEPWSTGRILMLEPRRLAARAAAARMAELLGEEVGETVGFRIRGEAKVSAATRIEVVTEGVLTRMLQSDPTLDGVSAVIFDEFHERSVHADLGLAFCWEARNALREDLRILVMSATLDAAPVAALLGDAPIVRSDGRAYPVETKWLEPVRSGQRSPRLDEAAAALIRQAHDEAEGDILVFLPGGAEIARTERRLAGLWNATDIRPLFGAMPFEKQRAALAPSHAGRRKVVLSTAIAETSLTVEGVRVIVDAGYARRAVYDPASGMSRLITERVSKAEAEQRRGRAGRVAPGVCYRMWTKGEEGGLSPFAPPEIELADLAALALDLAAWGASPDDLAFLTPPPAGAFERARKLLRGLGALDGQGRITAHGRRLAAAPTHPRLAHMILSAPKREAGAACAIAALIEERDPLRGAGSDLSLRLRALAAPGDASAGATGALHRIRKEAERLAQRLGVRPGWRSDAPGALIARAYPDRIAVRRLGGEARFVLSGGKGARLDAADDLSGARHLVAIDLDGDAREATIRLAAPISRAEIEENFGDELSWRKACVWSRRERKVEALERLMLGEAVLESRKWADASGEQIAAAMIDGVRDLGLEALPWTKAARRLQARTEWARARGADAPAVDDETLLATLDTWLAPHLEGVATAAGLVKLNLADILTTHIGWTGSREVDRVAPTSFTAPTGTNCAIDYAGAAPSISVRLQELFGLNAHPQVGGEPLIIELLSPASRPVQTTADLPGFWRSSYADVRKDMRGRYPKHPWPEDPASAPPTRRAKPRK